MSGKLVPALIAGVATFFVSFIIGLVPVVGCCALIMPIIGGIFAVFLYSNKASIVSPGAGASVGLMAGGVHGILTLVITPITIFLQWATLQAQIEEATRRSNINIEGGALIALIVVALIIGIVLIIGLYALGGLIGGAIFKKEGQQSSNFEPPMPPSSYGV